MSKTPKTDEVWQRVLREQLGLVTPLMLIAEMLERIAIALEGNDE